MNEPSITLTPKPKILSIYENYIPTSLTDIGVKKNLTNISKWNPEIYKRLAQHSKISETHLSRSKKKNLIIISKEKEKKAFHKIQYPFMINYLRTQ